MITVIIKECIGTMGKEWSSTHNTDNSVVAIKEAVEKHFGYGTRFLKDYALTHNLGSRYGQIGYYVDNIGCNCMLTKRIRIDTLEESKSSEQKQAMPNV